MNNHRICHICYPCCISSSTVAGSPAPLCHCAVLSFKSNAPTSPVSTVPHCSRNLTLHQRLHCIFFSSTANMAKVNGCLKCIFTGFNIFFAIVGGAIIGLALLSQVYTNTSGSEMEGRTTSLLSLYILGTVTMIVAILGAYGANKENKVCLIVFLVCMIVGALAMLRAGFVATAARPLVEPQLEEKFRQLLPLNEAPEEAKAMADGLQTMAHCCGLFSYNDWGNDIPDSCMCDEEEQEEGLCQSVGYRLAMSPKKSIYSQTCFPIIMYYVMLLLDVVMGVAFTLASLAILGMILSSIIIHQLRHPDRPTVLLSVPAVFTPSTPKYQELQYPPPKYQELHNPPPY